MKTLRTGRFQRIIASEEVVSQNYIHRLFTLKLIERLLTARRGRSETNNESMVNSESEEEENKTPRKPIRRGAAKTSAPKEVSAPGKANFTLKKN